MNSIHMLKSLSAGLGVLALSLLADGTTNTAQASCVPEPYLGSTCTTAANFCPRGYSPMDGQIITINSNTALFALLGTNFGGDGRNTFGLPDMRGRTSAHVGSGPGLSTVFLGQKRGDESVVQSISELAQHAHTATFTPVGDGGAVDVMFEAATNSSANIKTPVAGAYVSVTGSGLSAQDSFVAPGTQTGTVELGGVSVTGGGSGTGIVTVNPAGRSTEMDIVPPQIGMIHCIATTGLFPPRS